MKKVNAAPNLLKVYKDEISRFSGIIQADCQEFDTQIIRAEGKQYYNITDDPCAEVAPIKECIARTIFNCSGFNLVFTFEGQTCSLLFTVVFDKDGDKSGYSFFELTNIIAPNDFRCYNSTHLIDEPRLKLAFDWLLNGVITHLEAIRLLAGDEEGIKALANIIAHDVAALRKQSRWQALRSGSAYYQFCRNNYPKAIALYSAMEGRLTFYEQRLLTFMRQQLDSGKSDYLAIPEEIDGLKTLATENKRSIFELITFYLAMPLAFALGAIPFVGTYFLYYGLAVGEYCIRPQWQMTLVPGFFAGVFVSLLFHKPILKLLMRAKYRSYMATQKFLSGKTDTVILSVLGGIVAIACIAFMVLYLNWNVIFHEDGFSDNSRFFSLRAEYVEYSQVEALYYVRAYLNAYGEVYPEGAYAIKLKSGQVIDFRGVGDPDQATLAFLKAKQLEMREVDFIIEIP